MPGATTLYFPEVGPEWQDWVQVTNVGTEDTRVTGIARHAGNGQPTWSADKTISSFESWIPPVDEIKTNSSMQFTADQPIVAERHMHKDTNVLDFIGAAPEYGTVGQRLFFPELVSGAHDWFRVLNVGEADAHVNITVRNRNGDVLRQRHHVIEPLCCWDLNEGVMGNVTGTVEMQSSQPIVGERHLHYQGGKTSVGQFGQMISDAPRTLYFPEVGPAWEDWVVIVNVGREDAEVTMVARKDDDAKSTWTKKRDRLRPFECWTPPMDDITVKSSVEVRSNQPVVAERHMQKWDSHYRFTGCVGGGRTGGNPTLFP